MNRYFSVMNKRTENSKIILFLRKSGQAIRKSRHEIMLNSYMAIYIM